MKKIAILQPNYLPWKGVFDLIDRVDTFVFFDDVQYTKKDWRNRNRIKTHAGGLQWISVPTRNAGRDSLIKDVVLDSSSNWNEKHLKSISHAYQGAPFFEEYRFLIDQILIENKWERLCDLNFYSTKLIAEALGIEAEWAVSSELDVTGDKGGERVIKMCEKLDCDHFINGPASKAFMDEALFNEAGIELNYIEYNYRPYPQLHGDFVHEVTALDLLFNCGPDSLQWIRS